MVTNCECNLDGQVGTWVMAKHGCFCGYRYYIGEGDVICGGPYAISIMVEFGGVHCFWVAF